MVKQVRAGTSMAEFQREIQAQALTVVDFCAEWCGPCKMIAPQIDQLSMVHSHITFLKVDVDQCPELSGGYSIAAMPTFIVFARGKEVGRMTGANMAQLTGLLQRSSAAPAAAPMGGAPFTAPFGAQPMALLSAARQLGRTPLAGVLPSPGVFF